MFSATPARLIFVYARTSCAVGSCFHRLADSPTFIRAHTLALRPNRIFENLKLDFGRFAFYSLNDDVVSTGRVIILPESFWLPLSVFLSPSLWRPISR